MTVFITSAPADRDAAEALEKFIERRGQFTEMDDGQAALRPVQPNDVVVLLVSQHFVFAPTRLRLEQRALDAWSDGRLIIVKLDTSLAPVGLRDLPAIDASFDAQREFKWQEVANAVREKLNAQPPAETHTANEAPPPAMTPPRKSSVWIYLMLALLALGVAALPYWALVGTAPRIETRFTLLAGALALLALVAALLFRGALARPRRSLKRPPPAEATIQGAGVFISYARANQKLVLPVIEAAQGEGHEFWLDQKGIGAGGSWAGEIVRAIKGSAWVVVMCSKAAFESDHVKREIYLADRYRKKLAPVYIEPAEAPEDFEYFFAGVQSLNLFETPEAERGQALVRALGAI
jgi:hypothetical protein